jgi:Concanavalin A-like lectin/glucanases superfamily
MTIDSAYFPEIRKNHGGTVYSFGFEVIDPSYVVVYSIDEDGDYALISSDDYVVSVGNYIAPISKGGYITFDAPFLFPSISIHRVTDITDEQEFSTGQPFNAESFEFQCDKLTMILQELNATKCDCAEYGIPVPVMGSLATFLDESTVTFDGYSANFGNIVVDPTGQYMLFNHKGYGRQRYSNDYGATWALAPLQVISGGSAGDTTNWPNTHMVWSPSYDGFVCQIYRADTRSSHISVYNPYTNSWAGIGHRIGTYTRSFHVGSGSTVYYLDGGSPDKLTLCAGIKPDGSAPDDDVEFDDSEPSPGGIIILEVIPGYLFCGGSLEGGVEPWYVWFVHQPTLTYVSYGSALTDNKRCATSGKGTVAAKAGITANFFNIEVIRFLGEPGPLTFKTIDFGVNISSQATISYSPGLNGYIVSAVDEVNRSLLHLRHSKTVGGVDNTDNWYELGSVTLSNPVASGSLCQLLWVQDNEYLYSYQVERGSVTYNVVERIEINELVVIEDLTLLLNHCDSKVGVLFPSANITFPDITAINSYPLNTNVSHVKYGAGSMGNVATGYGRVTLPDLNTNNFTANLYYKPISLPGAGNVQGLLHVGPAAQSTNAFRLYVTETGAIELAQNINSVALMTGAACGSAAGVIVAGTMHEIAMELDPDTSKASIYVDGNRVAQATYEQTGWLTAIAKDVQIGYTYTSGVNRYSNGYIDEVQISNGAFYKGALTYPPNTTPFG